MKICTAFTSPRLTAAWCLRWLLVLLLLADQVSAPLHRHHHESGIDATVATAGIAHLVEPHGLHWDEEDSSATHHATAALRADPRAAVAGERVWLADQPPPLPATWTVFALFLPRSSTVSWRPSDGPPPSVPLSLPPDGRAPPARA